MSKRPLDSGSFEVLTWRRSSRSGSGAGNNCVEAGSCARHGVAVRDSKAPAIGALAMSPADWTALLRAIRA